MAVMQKDTPKQNKHMTLTEILLVVGLFLIIVNIFISLLKKPVVDTRDIKTELTKTNQDISKIDPLIRTEFSNNRTEIQTNSKETRQELSNSFSSFSEQQTKKTDTLIQNFTESSKDNRKELTTSLKSFEDRFTESVKEFNELQRQKFNDLLNKQDQTKTDTELKRF